MQMLMQSTVKEISDTIECSSHNYRTEIPNILYHMGLDAYEFTVYCILKSTSGDKGKCYKSNETLASEAHCSIRLLIALKKSLVEKNLIKVQKRTHENGGSLPDLITIIDIWGENAKFNADRSKNGPRNSRALKTASRLKVARGGARKGAGGVHSVHEGGAPKSQKQDLLQEDLLQEQQQEAPEASESADANVVVFFSDDKEQKQEQKLQNNPPSLKLPITPKAPDIHKCLKNIQIPVQVKIDLTSKYTEEVISNALAYATHPTTIIKTGLPQTLYWACQHGIGAPVDKVALVTRHETYAKLYEKKFGSQVYKGVRLSACHGYVELSFSGQQMPVVISYTDNNFVALFQSKLEKYEFPILPISVLDTIVCKSSLTL